AATVSAVIISFSLRSLYQTNTFLMSDAYTLSSSKLGTASLKAAFKVLGSDLGSISIPLSKISANTKPSRISPSVVYIEISSSALILEAPNAGNLLPSTRDSTITLCLAWETSLKSPECPEIAKISFNIFLKIFVQKYYNTSNCKSSCCLLLKLTIYLQHLRHYKLLFIGMYHIGAGSYL